MIEGQLSYSLFSPLIVAAIVYALLYVASGVVRARGSAQTADRMLDLGFGIALLAAAWVAVLLVISVVSESDQVYDMVVVLLVVGGFFALLLALLFGVFEVIFSRGSRGPRRGD